MDGLPPDGEPVLNVRTLLFLARKDLGKDLRVLALVVLAVGSGSLALVPIRGLADGILASVVATTVDVSTGHVILSPTEDRAFLQDVTDLLSALATLPSVEGVSPRLMERCVVQHADKSTAAPAVGVIPGMEARTTLIARKIVAGRFLLDTDTSHLVLGRQLAERLRVAAGDDVGVVFGDGSRQRFEVAGIFEAGMPQLDSQLFLNLRRLQSLRRLQGRASEIAVRLASIDLADRHRLRLQRMGFRVKVETWRDRLQFVENFKGNMAFFQRFLILLTCVAAGIATGVLLYTNFQHKRRALGVLKAIGAKDREVLALYLLEGLLIGVSGTIVGNLLGGGLAYYMSTHPVGIRMTVTSASFYAVLSFQAFITPTVVILLTTAVSALYPAWRASRMPIVEAIWAA